MKSQADKVLDHLKQGNRITQKRAAHDFHIWRLADVVYKLRRRGHDIGTRTINRRNRRTGRLVSYAEYFLL